ncbi:MAG TPA: phospholipase D family protein [Burkholderiales bacterium]
MNRALASSIAAASIWAAPIPSMPAWAFDASSIVPATGTIEFAFTPGDDAAGLVIRAIDAARLQVLVQAFSFTHEKIAAALNRAHRRGIDVQVLVDPQQVELIDHNVVGLLKAAKVPVFTDGMHSAAHNKIVLIDAREEQPVLVTGSFNFTFAAQYRNAENLLVIRGNRELARAYLDNWERHRAHSVPFNSATEH